MPTTGLGSLAQPQGFLGNPDTALPTLIVVMAWSAIPVAILLYLTGLQAIDPAVLDAASVDGAGAVRSLRSVIWPLLRPITAAVILLNLRDALQGFQIFLIMTNGGPGGHTNVLGLQTYSLAFLSQLRPTLGLASALGWILFVAALLLAAVNIRSVPASLRESARCDGAGEARTFWSIYLPTCRPALIAVALLTAIPTWNEYVLTRVSLNDPATFTLPLGLQSLNSTISPQYNVLMAASLIIVIPIVVLFVLLQRYFVNGLVGAVKG